VIKYLGSRDEGGKAQRHLKARVAAGVPRRPPWTRNPRAENAATASDGAAAGGKCLERGLVGRRSPWKTAPIAIPPADAFCAAGRAGAEGFPRGGPVIGCRGFVCPQQSEDLRG
jgi:hypothetical protein